MTDVSDNAATHNISESSVVRYDKRLATLTPWTKETRPQAAGRAVGSRNRFSERYVDDLLTTWQEGGIDALRRVRDKDPSTYVRVAASLIPRQSAHIRANVSQSIGGDVARDALLRAAAAMGLQLTDTKSVAAIEGGRADSSRGIEKRDGELSQSSVGGESQEQPLVDNSTRPLATNIPKPLPNNSASTHTSNNPEVPVISGRSPEVYEAGGQPSGKS